MMFVVIYLSNSFNRELALEVRHKDSMKLLAININQNLMKNPIHKSF